MSDIFKLTIDIVQQTHKEDRKENEETLLLSIGKRIVLLCVYFLFIALISITFIVVTNENIVIEGIQLIAVAGAIVVATFICIINYRGNAVREKELGVCNKETTRLFVGELRKIGVVSVDIIETLIKELEGKFEKNRGEQHAIIAVVVVILMVVLSVPLCLILSQYFIDANITQLYLIKPVLRSLISIAISIIGLVVLGTFFIDHLFSFEKREHRRMKRYLLNAKHYLLERK